VNAPDGTPQHFLVEWYDPAFIAAPLPRTAAGLQTGAVTASADGTAVRLELTLAAPTDDVLYGVFSADSAEAVLRACGHAGHVPDRITAGVRVHLSTHDVSVAGEQVISTPNAPVLEA
jgi:hypothetical protein